MSAASEQQLQEMAARVARRMASERDGSAIPAAGYTLLVLSGCGAGLDRALDRVAAKGGAIVGVSDCHTGSGAAVGTAMARLPGLVMASIDSASDAERLVDGATSVVAPSLDLPMASRVAGLQTDTPGARVVLRALLKGVPVTATIDDSDFSVSADAPAGARRAVAHVLDRLRDLGVALGGEVSSPAASAAEPLQTAAYGAGLAHPSLDRFSVAEPLNEFIEYLESRPCMIEQGKPCVECGACENRGF